MCAIQVIAYTAPTAAHSCNNSREEGMLRKLGQQDTTLDEGCERCSRGSCRRQWLIHLESFTVHYCFHQCLSC